MRDRYRSNSRFTCTTNLTHGVSRSPLTRYGRHYWAAALPLGSQSNRIVVVYCLSLDILTRLSGALRLSYLKTPVETLTAPCEFYRYIIHLFWAFVNSEMRLFMRALSDIRRKILKNELFWIFVLIFSNTYVKIKYNNFGRVYFTPILRRILWFPRKDMSTTSTYSRTSSFPQWDVQSL